MSTLDLEVRVLLSAQRALVGEIFPGLRKVDVSWDESHVHLKFFVDRTPAEEDLESISRIETEMLAALDPELTVTSTVIRPGEKSDRGELCIFSLRPDDL